MIFATRKAEQNQAVVDPWTLVHFACGLAAGLLNVPTVPAVGAAVAYELVEHQAQKHPEALRAFNVSGPEVLSNQIVDVGVFALGVYLGKRWNRT